MGETGGSSESQKVPAGEAKASASGRKHVVPGRWRAAVPVLVALLVVALGGLPLPYGALRRALETHVPFATGSRQGRVARVVLKVEGMDCILCAGGLQNTLRQIPGVRQAEVSYQLKSATIEYDPQAVEPARLVKVISDAGFTVPDVPRTKN
jgi:copper chaperone CopZ